MQTSLQELADKIALQEHLAMYTHALDERDWDKLTRVFADDFVSWRVFPSRDAYKADQPAFVTEGRQATVVAHGAPLDAMAQTNHCMSNIISEISGSTASVLFNLRAYHLAAGRGPDMFEQSLSFGAATARRTDQGWKLTQLDYVICIYQGTFEAFNANSDGASGPLNPEIMLRGG